MISSTRILLATAATAVALTGTPALAKKCEYVKNGECYKSTTYVYKRKTRAWTDETAYKNPVHQCRAACLRSVQLVYDTNLQTREFNSCAAKC